MIVMQDPMVIVEVDCTGTNPHKDQLIKIAAIGVDTHLVERGRFIRYIEFDEDAAKANVLQFNGYNEQSGRWEDAVSIGSAIKDFRDFLKPYQTIERVNPRGKVHTVRFAGFNINKFGLNALMNTVKKENVFIPMERYGLDVMQLTMALSAMGIMSPNSCYRDDLVKYFGIKVNDDPDFSVVEQVYQIAKSCATLLNSSVAV